MSIADFIAVVGFGSIHKKGTQYEKTLFFQTTISWI